MSPRLLALIAPALLVGTLSAAQETDTLKSLRTPASPAFVLLGIAPSAIERPSTPRALALSLLRATEDADVLPRNYALEVAPYWWRGHPDLTFEKYQAPSVWQSLKQSATISLATTPLAAADSGTAVGVGIRAVPLFGTLNPRVRPLRARLDSLQRELLRTDDPAAVARLRAALRDVSLAMRAPQRERYGLALEMAGAVVGDYPGDDFHRGRISRVGAWLTPTYRLASPAVDLLAVVRFVHDARPTPAEDDLDAGARIAARGRDLVLAMEGVWRRAHRAGAAARSTSRVAGTLEYRLNANVYLTAAFGRDFTDPATARTRLIAQFGIDLGFGQVLPVPFVRR